MSSTESTDLCNLADLLHWRALTQPDRNAYIFLVDGEVEENSLSYAQLDHHARVIAARLCAIGAT
jgi:acyl-CoA synthetase (AMP-forming)/AMP-acid ligase II